MAAVVCLLLLSQLFRIFEVLLMLFGFFKRTFCLVKKIFILNGSLYHNHGFKLKKISGLLEVAYSNYPDLKSLLVGLLPILVP